MNLLYTPLAVSSIAWLDRFAALWKKIALIEVSTAFLRNAPLRGLTSVKVLPVNQLVVCEFLEMKANLLWTHASVLSNRPVCGVTVLGKEQQNLLFYLCAIAGALWLLRYGELFYLRVAIYYKLLKLAYARHQTRVLVAKNAHLVQRLAQLEVKCGELFLRQRDALVFDRARRDVANDSLNGIEHTRRLTRSNENKMSHAAENATGCKLRVELRTRS